MTLRTFLVFVLIGAVMMLLSITLYGLTVGDEHVKFTYLMQTYLILSCAVCLSGGYLAFCPPSNRQAENKRNTDAELPDDLKGRTHIVRHKVLHVSDYGYCLARPPFEAESCEWLDYPTEELRAQALRLVALYGSAPMALVITDTDRHFELFDVNAALLDRQGSAVSGFRISAIKSHDGGASVRYHDVALSVGAAHSGAVGMSDELERLFESNPGKQIIMLSREMGAGDATRTYRYYVAV